MSAERLYHNFRIRGYYHANKEKPMVLLLLWIIYISQAMKAKQSGTKLFNILLQEDFNIDNRMFFITTLQERNAICVKAKHALNALDDYLKRYNKHSFQYITDFYTIDLSNDVDLYWPENDMRASLKGKNKETKS